MPINPAAQDAQLYEALGMGFRVDRAAATLPQGTDEALFSVSGGRVLITQVVGEVTVVIGGANATKLKFNPTETGSDIDLCGALDIDSDAVGSLYSISGDFSDALLGALVWAIETDAMMEKRGIVLSEGDIELDCAGSVTGEISWTIWYVPLDDGAVVTAA